MFAEAVLAKSLTAQLGSLGPGETVEIIVSSEGDDPLNDSEVAALQALGAPGLLSQNS